MAPSGMHNTKTSKKGSKLATAFTSMRYQANSQDLERHVLPHREIVHNVLTIISERVLGKCPPKILCDNTRCNTVKPKSEFGTGPLKRLIENHLGTEGFDATKHSRIRCKACNAPESEAKCFHCDEWKPKSSFNGTQWTLRSHGDEGEAVCEDCCRARREEFDPDLHDSDADEDDEDGGEDYMMTAEQCAPSFDE